MEWRCVIGSGVKVFAEDFAAWFPELLGVVLRILVYFSNISCDLVPKSAYKSCPHGYQRLALSRVYHIWYDLTHCHSIREWFLATGFLLDRIHQFRNLSDICDTQCELITNLIHVSDDIKISSILFLGPRLLRWAPSLGDCGTSFSSSITIDFWRWFVLLTVSRDFWWFEVSCGTGWSLLRSHSSRLWFAVVCWVIACPASHAKSTHWAGEDSDCW